MKWLVLHKMEIQFKKRFSNEIQETCFKRKGKSLFKVDYLVTRNLSFKT